jgi:hypothetical protein
VDEPSFRRTGIIQVWTQRTPYSAQLTRVAKSYMYCWGYQLHNRQKNDVERTRGPALQEALLREPRANIAKLTFWRSPRKWAMIQPWWYWRWGVDRRYRFAKIVWRQRCLVSMIGFYSLNFFVCAFERYRQMRLLADYARNAQLLPGTRVVRYNLRSSFSRLNPLRCDP